MCFHKVPSLNSFDEACRSTINFLAIGDWGGQDEPPYYTYSQDRTSFGMAKIAEENSVEFIIAAGDNFYNSGVRAKESMRFAKTWKDVYLKHESLNKPWFVVAGNHDHEGNVQAQIDYSKKNPLWVFPSFYHHRTYTDTDGTTVDLM